LINNLLQQPLLQRGRLFLKRLCPFNLSAGELLFFVSLLSFHMGLVFLSGKYDVALPFRGALGEIGAEVGSATLLSEKGGLSYQSTGQHQVGQLVGGAVWGRG